MKRLQIRFDYVHHDAHNPKSADTMLVVVLIVLSPVSYRIMFVLQSLRWWIFVGKKNILYEADLFIVYYSSTLLVFMKYTKHFSQELICCFYCLYITGALRSYSSSVPLLVGSVGKVTQVIGAVVDVQFSVGSYFSHNSKLLANRSSSYYINHC